MTQCSLVPITAISLVLCLLPDHVPAFQSPDQLQVTRVLHYTFQTPGLSPPKSTLLSCVHQEPSPHPHPVSGWTGMHLGSKATYRKACIPWLALWEEGHHEFGGHTALSGVPIQPPLNPLWTFL